MRDRLAETDFEMNELKEALQSCKENEVLLKNKIEFITRKNRNQQDLIKQVQETIEKLSNRSKTIATCTSTQTNSKILARVETQTEDTNDKANITNKEDLKPNSN
ncbi:hypothetical protein QE152_g32072 [Popillia japonica]|uniref:Uncharacterized protein n=1 Tax=Popillia japonica TaxID=7064 RepID=A0AAW1J0C4_POPJA